MYNKNKKYTLNENYIIRCLNSISKVNVIKDNNVNKIVLNNSYSYNSNIRYGASIGTYILTSIPQSHPIAILNENNRNITYSGNVDKLIEKEIIGTDSDGIYKFFWGDITINIKNNFNKVSIYCFNHGFMGGQNLLVYDKLCKNNNNNNNNNNNENIQNRNNISKFNMLYTPNNTVKCLNNRLNNIFYVKNNKIWFENNGLNNSEINKIAVYKGNFKLITKNTNLMFGIIEQKNIISKGNNFIKTLLIGNNNIDLYKNEITIEILDNIKNNKFYVIDEIDNIYSLDLIYNELCKNQLCNNIKYQTYYNKLLGKEITLNLMSSLSNKINCMSSNVYRIKKLNNQQNLYVEMRLHPEKFPIISSVKNLNLTLPQQRAYSNMWWKKLGTSQGLPINDNWGGFGLVGSDVPYTN